MDNQNCRVPLSAHITVDVDGRLTSTYEYSEIPTKVLADFLVQGFGIDVEDLFNSRTPVSTN